MKIEIPRKTLQQAVGLAAMVTPDRSVIDVHRYVRIKTDVDGGQSRIEISAVNQDRSLLAYSVCEVRKPGECLVLLSKLKTICSESPADSIVLESTAKGIEIRAGASVFRLPSIANEEFPKVDTGCSGCIWEVAALNLQLALERTVYCADTESSRYALGGVRLEMSPEQMTAVGTDGRRCSVHDAPCKLYEAESAPQSAAGILPGASVPGLLRALAGMQVDDKVAIQMDANWISFATDHWELRSRQIEGRYPNWRLVFPNPDNRRTFNVPAGVMLSAVRQVSITTTEDSRMVSMIINKNSAVLTTQSAEAGDSRTEVVITGFDEPVQVGVDWHYLADPLRKLSPSDDVEFELGNSEQPVVIRGDGSRYVLMPMSGR